MNLKEENFRYWVMRQAMEVNGDFISTHIADEIAKKQEKEPEMGLK